MGLKGGAHVRKKEMPRGTRREEGRRFVAMLVGAIHCDAEQASVRNIGPYERVVVIQRLSEHKNVEEWKIPSSSASHMNLVRVLSPLTVQVRVLEGFAQPSAQRAKSGDV
ncbi:hypothetical protein ACE6H2_027650 [Prunus campanulata]